MGTLYQSTCDSCNKKFNSLGLGYGMMSSQHSGFYIPCICENCKSVEKTDLFTKGGSIKKRYSCPKCKKGVEPIGFIVNDFDSPSSDEEEYVMNDLFWNGEGGVIIQQTYLVEDKNYKCPKCGNESLHFHWSGLWD